MKVLCRSMAAGLLCGLGALAPGAAQAQVVSACDHRASADYIVEPWGEFSRSFANGDVRLALLDQIEPAASAFSLLLLSPPFSPLGERQCRIIGLGSTMGFASVDFHRLTADYDPARGLIFDVPVAIYDGASGANRPAWITIVLNQSTGQVDVFQHAGG